MNKTIGLVLISSLASVIGGAIGCNSTTTTTSYVPPAPSAQAQVPHPLATSAAPDGAPKGFAERNFTVVDDDQTRLHNKAWRDSSGAVWSPYLTEAVSAKTVEAACEHFGAAAPSVKQLESLATYLGRGSDAGFHPESLKMAAGVGGGASWGSLKGMLLIGKDSLNLEGGLRGIDGDDGNTEEFSASGIPLEVETGYPLDFTTNSSDPTQTNFSTICIFPAAGTK